MRRIARPLLVVGVVAAVSASWLHLVAWLARYETGPQWWVACLAAVAIDVGLLAALRTVGEEAERGRPTRDAMLVVALLVAVSFAANVQHALSIRPGDVLNAVAVAGVLPLVALSLSRLYDVVSRPAAATTTAPLVKVSNDLERPKTRQIAPQRPDSRRAEALLIAERDGVHVSTAYRRLAKNGNGHAERWTRGHE